MDLIRSFDGTITETIVWPGGNVVAELNTIETCPDAASFFRHHDHLLVATLSGGGDRVLVAFDGKTAFTGRKSVGSAGFCPAGRELKSVWPQTQLTYVSLLLPQTSLEAALHEPLKDGEWLAESDISDSFMRIHLQEFGASLQRAPSAVETLYRESIITVIELRLLRCFSTFKMAEPFGKDALQDTLDYIEAHLSAEITLGALASTSGLSRTRLRAAFRSRTGMTPYRYVTVRRLEKAKELLSKSEMTVAAIAKTTGFGDQSRFSVAFRKHFGIPPAVWRRYQIRNNKSKT